MLFRIGVSLFLFGFCLMQNAQTVTAQNDLASMCESWNKCNAGMTEKFKALDEGDVTPGLADDYKDLVDEANELIKKMRQQGVAELKERPGDGKVIRALLGIMVHDAQSGRDSMVLDVGQKLIEAKINPKYFEAAAGSGGLELSQKHIFDELEARHADAMADDLPRVKLITTAGEITLELYENQAPNTVRNFVSLIESGFYSDKLFHRVIENSVAQGGGYETEGIGSGGPGYEIECECREADARRNFPGTISMAHAGRDTGGSQFFLNFKYNDMLDGKNTVFGRIIEGMDVLDKIDRTELIINGMERVIEQAKPDRIVSAEVVRKRDHSYRGWKKGETKIDFEAEAEAKKKAEAEAKKKAEAEAKKKAEAEAKKESGGRSEEESGGRSEKESGGRSEKESGGRSEKESGGRSEKESGGRSEKESRGRSEKESRGRSESQRRG